jgi:ankyrin repeat protein
MCSLILICLISSISHAFGGFRESYFGSRAMLDAQNECDLIPIAIETNNIDKFKRLLIEGRDPNWLDSLNDSPIKIAAYNGLEEYLRELLVYGANFVAKCKDRTPIEWALIYTNTGIILLIREYSIERQITLPENDLKLLEQNNMGTIADYKKDFLNYGSIENRLPIVKLETAVFPQVVQAIIFQYLSFKK